MNTIKRLIIIQHLYNACEQSDYEIPNNILDYIPNACIIEYATGYHKAGEYLVNKLLENMNSVQKINICFTVACYGTSDLIHLITEKFPQTQYFLFISKNEYTPKFVSTAVYHNNTDFVRWIIQETYDIDSEVYTTACKQNSIDCLKLLHNYEIQHGKPSWTQCATKTAITYSNIECYKYCIDNNCDYDLNDILSLATVDLYDHWWRKLLQTATHPKDALRALRATGQTRSTIHPKIAHYVNTFFKELHQTQTTTSKALINHGIPSDLSKWISLEYL